MSAFAFPQSGSLKPPDPPRAYTMASLETCYQQASTLWPGITRQSCANALASEFADGDPSKATTLIQFFRAAADGYVTPVCRRNGTYLPLRGAINVRGVSCYVDSLLVAMFSRMENFEPLLYKRPYDRDTDRFATWLRLFVNLLRNGERVTADIVTGLMAAAVSAGWATCSPLSQQDAAEFFVFVTEKLLMPLLVLRVDIAHAGREQEEFDHKLIKEQLLYLPVPGTEQDPPLLLEECFEIYFSNVINVSRHLSLPGNQGMQQNTPYAPSAAPSGSPSRSGGVGTSGPSGGPSSGPSGGPSGGPPGGPLGGPSGSQPLLPPLPVEERRPTFVPASPERSREQDEVSQRSSISGMASTVANWLSSSTDRAPGRRRSYSIISLTSSPGVRRNSRRDDIVRPSLPETPMRDSFDSVFRDDTPDAASRGSRQGSQVASLREDSVDPLDESHPLPGPTASGVGSAPMAIPGKSGPMAGMTPVLPAPQPSQTSQAPMANPLAAQASPSAPLAPRASVLAASDAEEASSSLPSYHQLFGSNEDRQAEARVRDMKHSLWTSNNEVMLPAWMFLQLMPFYADNVPANDEPIENLGADEVAHHFQRARPVLGICLKRYYVDENGQPHRNNRRVIVPETINMPSFVADDSDKQQAFGKFKLVLESAVFHRGSSIASGHYFTLLAESSNHRAKNASGSWPVPPSPGMAPFTDTELRDEGPSRKWLLFDDMQHGGDRVKEVNPTDVFLNDTPYMLFYRMVSLEDEDEPSPSLMPLVHQQRSSHSLHTLLDSRAPSPEPAAEPVLEPGKDKKKKPKFFRRHKDKDGKEKESGHKDGSHEKERSYASKYREEKCAIM